ncbi:hypothetical protein SUGI_0896100 [Cryptomeria japonica]|nr:hypothetical protein SUGI_0896100 [Cryptomeria japonica]
MAHNATESYGSELWHSPLPYMLGGGCAVVVLVVAAIIIMAYSNRKKAMHPQASSDVGAGLRSFEDGGNSSNTESSWCDEKMENSVIVIMAGDEKPRFVATPIMLSSLANEEHPREESISV